MSEWLANAELVERLGLGAFITIGALWFAAYRVWPFIADSVWPVIVERLTASAREREEREKHYREERAIEREEFLAALEGQRDAIRSAVADSGSGLQRFIAGRDEEQRAFFAGYEKREGERAEVIVRALATNTAAIELFTKTGQGTTKDEIE